MGDLRRVTAPPGKPLLLFDGDCGFCRRWIQRWKQMTGNRLDYAASQEAGGRFPEIPKEAFARSVQLVTPDGEVFEGAEAVFRSLALGGHPVPLALYRRIPGARPVAELLYRLVARHRKTASAATNLLWGKTLEHPTYRLANGLFLRLVGVCYFAAFVSLSFQVDGLVGSRGILPVGNLLEAARVQLSEGRWVTLPTLCWLDGSDAFLHFLCAGGAAAALLLAFGILPVGALLVCWAFYLSLCVAGQEFLQFQWDLLLLETGFLAIWLAPVKRWRAGLAVEGSTAARVLLLWLLFRLMFSSGFVKLASGDPNWKNLTALAYHYWTQPLPPWTAWFMNRLPLAFQRVSCVAMFAVELGAPFLILAPRRLRLFAAAAMAGLEVLIAATGNYAFFNLLTVALCLLLVDDAAFPRRLRERAAADPSAARGKWPLLVVAPVAAALLLASAVLFSFSLGARLPWPRFAVSAARAGLSFRSVGTYGLFMVMTTRRPEIVVEGSEDGEVWHAYEFRWKPGDVTRRPRFVAPHQPRLDWQMWFAALGACEENPWFQRFLARLLEGSPPVLALLEKNPFPANPPRYIRAVLYDYNFTDGPSRRSTGAWWRRQQRGLYCPVFSRDMLRPSLVPAPKM